MTRLPKAKKTKPVLGITLGDPAGIGPEVIARTLKQKSLRAAADLVLIGDETIFGEYFPKRYPNCEFLDLKTLGPEDVQPGRPNPKTATAALQYLKTAVELLKNQKISALVTGPVSKEAIGEALGRHFQGHTEFLAENFKVTNFDMMFVGRKLRTVVVTRHIPLCEVSAALTTAKIEQTIELTHSSLRNHFRITQPRIAVCGLNPHAGEGGKIGREEIDTIIPAIANCQAKKIPVQGPFPADTVFSADLFKRFDAVVAMYHDQGIIPVKTLCFKELVNMTIGLPFVRTSPAHGTAFNIAGKNIADPGSMAAAIKLAAELSCR